MQTRTLNFFPYYEDLLINKKKFTTLRLGDKRNLYRNNDIVSITMGWCNDSNKKVIGKVCITDIYCKQIKELTKEDLEGESPDCIEPLAVKYVLSAIYKKVVTDHNIVTIIKWEYI